MATDDVSLWERLWNLLRGDRMKKKPWGEVLSDIAATLERMEKANAHTADMLEHRLASIGLYLQSIDESIDFVVAQFRIVRAAYTASFLVDGVPMEEGSMYQLPDDAVGKRLGVEFFDKNGNPGALIDAPPVWESSNPSVLTVVTAADGMSCELVPDPSAGLGTAQVSVKALAAGVEIIGLLDIEVVAGEAVTAVISPL